MGLFNNEKIAIIIYTVQTRDFPALKQWSFSAYPTELVIGLAQMLETRAIKRTPLIGPTLALN